MYNESVITILWYYHTGIVWYREIEFLSNYAFIFKKLYLPEAFPDKRLLYGSNDVGCDVTAYECSSSSAAVWLYGEADP